MIIFSQISSSNQTWGTCFLNDYIRDYILMWVDAQQIQSFVTVVFHPVRIHGKHKTTWSTRLVHHMSSWHQHKMNWIRFKTSITTSVDIIIEKSTNFLYTVGRTRTDPQPSDLQIFSSVAKQTELLKCAYTMYTIESVKMRTRNIISLFPVQHPISEGVKCLEHAHLCELGACKLGLYTKY